MSHLQLTAFGLFAVTAMIVCYELERRSAWFTLAFALSCVLGSIYGFLQGAWPFGIAEAFWGIVAANKWRRLSTVPRGDSGGDAAGHSGTPNR